MAPDGHKDQPYVTLHHCLGHRTNLIEGSEDGLIRIEAIPVAILTVKKVTQSFCSFEL